ncbi:MAG: hypothetical protein GY771_09760 [bacterium]|nr:hypothetical protein [bacterium]
MPGGVKRTFPGMPAGKKNKISHRYRAFRQIAAALKKLYG